MILFEVAFETPRGHYMHVLITAEDFAHAKRMTEEMLREFGEEAILSGKVRKPEGFCGVVRGQHSLIHVRPCVTWLLAD